MPEHIRAVPPDPRPEIRINHELARMTDEAITVIAEHDRGVFQRGGELVHVVKTLEPPKMVIGPNKRRKLERGVGVPLIKSLAAPTLRERVGALAQWKKFDGRAKGWVHTMPPADVIAGVHARGEWGGVRQLVGVTTTPTIRPDGSILQSPGYDPSTALLYFPNAAYPNVPDRPTHEDAKHAYAALLEAIVDFPFARDFHRAAWVTAVLSMLARSAIEGPVPLFAIDAPTAGTGKSKLADAAGRLALGYRPARIPMPDEDAEMRKLITTLVLDGDAAAFVDNVAGLVKLPSLENAITSDVWKDRVLGRTGSISAPMKIVWFITGNNLALGGDLSRRTITIRLASMLEDPETRTDFRHPNLFGWIEEHRHHLVVWGLTLLRAWYVAGEPQAASLNSGFPEWMIAPHAVAWASGIDPMKAQIKAAGEADGEKLAIGALLAALAHVTDEYKRAITAKEFLTALYPASSQGASTPPAHRTFAAAREAIESHARTKPGRDPDSGALGHWFRRIRDRPVNGMRLEQAEQLRDGNRAWFTARLDGGGS